MVVEGILVLHDPTLRERFDLKVYVDADADVRFIRRLNRDVEERGRTPDSIIEQYLTTVRPGHEQYIEPSKRYADVILSGEGGSRAGDRVVAGPRARAHSGRLRNGAGNHDAVDDRSHEVVVDRRVDDEGAVVDRSDELIDRCIDGDLQLIRRSRESSGDLCPRRGAPTRSRKARPSSGSDAEFRDQRTQDLAGPRHRKHVADLADVRVEIFTQIAGVGHWMSVEDLGERIGDRVDP